MKTPVPKTILTHYLYCALWSSTDEDGDPLGQIYDSNDVSPELLLSSMEDVMSLVNTHRKLLTLSGMSDEQIGHDFWLTRNRHGAGFWDRGLGEVGEQLSKIARAYGEVDLYVGDDGEIYSL